MSGNASDMKVNEQENMQTSESVTHTTDGAPRGWIIIQRAKKEKDYTMSYTISRIFDTFTKHGFKMRVINSRDIDIYLTNYERKSILVNDVITKIPDFVLSRTGANTSFSTLAIYRHLERLGMY